ncbi:hypothetical protein AB833_24765 [Chromatiales bacterium (ex Bugula neritina AB1)]|nr:hypothetical protein AB833_24765 [Chromatiales bacterium (ex Bugula neritina AB1)]
MEVFTVLALWFFVIGCDSGTSVVVTPESTVVELIDPDDFIALASDWNGPLRIEGADRFTSIRRDAVANSGMAKVNIVVSAVVMEATIVVDDDFAD